MTPTLAPGERVLIHWTISAASMAWRTLFIVLITGLFPGTLVALNGGIVSQAVTLILLMPLSGLFYMWVFDEFRPWTENRRRHWWLTDRAILTAAPESGQVGLALMDIAAVRRPVPWTLVLKLRSGQRIPLPIPPRPRALQNAIHAAIREAQTGAAT